jgi:hypothetical protein
MMANNEQPAATVDLPAGSIVVERYKPDNGRVQWLAQVVTQDGSLRLYAVCKTRHEALVEADRRG